MFSSSKLSNKCFKLARNIKAFFFNVHCSVNTQRWRLLPQEGFLPRELLSLVCSFLTLQEVQIKISSLCRFMRYDFFMDPASMHWRIVYLSDNEQFSDGMLLQFIKWGVLEKTEALILRRTMITAKSIRSLMDCMQTGCLHSLKHLDIRGCFMSSFHYKFQLKSKFPNIVQWDHDVTEDLIFFPLASYLKDVHFVESLTMAVPRKRDPNKPCGIAMEGCGCLYCCEYNLKMEFCLRKYPFSVDVAAFNCNFRILEAFKDVKICSLLCTTSPQFALDEKGTNLIMHKVAKYRKLLSRNDRCLTSVYSKPFSLDHAGLHYTRMKCLVDRCGMVLVFVDDSTQNGLVAVPNDMGFVLTSFNVFIKESQAICSCRRLALSLQQELFVFPSH